MAARFSRTKVYCRGSRVGCYGLDSAGGTPDATVLMSRLLLPAFSQASWFEQETNFSRIP
jgi:hypothetical protein